MKLELSREEAEGVIQRQLREYAKRVQEASEYANAHCFDKAYEVFPSEIPAFENLEVYNETTSIKL
jgi:hypothetical protein